MRLVFVNYAHPEVRHVSAMRLFFFSKAMAARGHQVVLLTGKSPEPGTKCITAEDLVHTLAIHDWTVPLVLPVAELRLKETEKRPVRQFATLPRKLRTAWTLAVGNGIHAGWVIDAMPVAGVLAERFRPELVWATFGNTSNLLLGQRLARRARCPWVADVKDNWVQFVPRGLRKAVAWRFRDAAALTSNARLHLDVAMPCFGPKRGEIVYSGVADAFYQARKLPLEASARPYLALIGSTYSRDRLAEFIGTFQAWRTGKPESGLRLAYAGCDVERVAAAARAAGVSEFVDVQAQLPLSALAVLLRQAAAVCYLGAETTFHHKLLELLVVGRPVLCYPREHAESLALAAQSPTAFTVCRDRHELMRAFDLVRVKEIDALESATEPTWRWSDMAIGLGNIFSDVVMGRTR